MKKLGHLALADGRVFNGQCLFETDEIVVGEVVFSTATTGYTEVLTDPSYFGQIIVFANPEIGNYGVNKDDFQSDGIKAKALVLRNLSSCSSSFRSQLTLTDWLLREQIPVIFNVDTRALISHIRDNGAMMAAFSTNLTKDPKSLFEVANAAETMKGKMLSSSVSIRKPMSVEEVLKLDDEQEISDARKFRIVVVDFGVKNAILKNLRKQFATVILVPSDSSPEEIWAFRPDGLFLSNGPGDPMTEKTAVATVKAFLGKLPIFGVCLGHQILAQAIGHSTYKLKFGHRGSNQAVKLSDDRVITTAQNHGFAVSEGELLADIKTDKNVSDGTNEGLDLPKIFAFSVQFHPEGAPGPHDAIFLFEKFFAYIDAWKKSATKDGYASVSSLG